MFSETSTPELRLLQAENDALRAQIQQLQAHQQAAAEQ